MPDKDNIEARKLSAEGDFCWFVSVILDMPICFALIGLSLSIFSQIYDNMTTIEGFGRHGIVQRRFPCLGIPRGYRNFIINPYDILWPNNIS